MAMANTLHEPRLQPLGNTFLHYQEHSSVAATRSRSFSDYVTYRQCQRVGCPGYSQSLHNGAPTNDLKELSAKSGKRSIPEFGLGLPDGAWSRQSTECPLDASPDISRQSTEDEVIQEQLHSTTAALQEMKKIFQTADRDGSGAISLEEFEEHLSKKEVRAHLSSLGIETDRAKGLFRLLDLDMSGQITIEEFVYGCMRLKGAAKSIDLATLMYENKRMAEQWRRFFTWSEAQFRRLHRSEARIDERLAGLLGEDICSAPLGEASRTSPRNVSGASSAPVAHSAPASPVCNGFDDKASCNPGSAAVVPGVGAWQRTQGKEKRCEMEEDDHYLAADKPWLSNSPPHDSSTDAGSPRSGHSSEDKYTTLMIRNLPYDLEQSDVVEELDRSGCKDLYDFVYMPCTFQTGRGKGYAFVNFEAHEDAAKFVRHWHKSRRFRMCESSQSLNVSVATVQGREDNIRKWDVPRMRRVKNPGYRPLVAMYAMTANGMERQLVPNAVVESKPILKANNAAAWRAPAAPSPPLAIGQSLKQWEVERAQPPKQPPAGPSVGARCATRWEPPNNTVRGGQTARRRQRNGQSSLRGN